MLILKPNQPIYLLTRDGEYGVERASVAVSHYTDEGAVISIRDVASKGGMRYVDLSVTNKNSAQVLIPDGEVMLRCYVSIKSDGQLGFDADREKIMILRRNHMLRHSFRPKWDK